jgi:hypothetical protein
VTTKIYFENNEVGEFLTDSEKNYMGVTWLTNDLDQQKKQKIQDLIEQQYVPSNKIPVSPISILSSQID